MTGAVNLSTGTKNLTVGKVRLSGGLKTIVAGFQRTTGGLKQIYGAISVSLSETSTIGRANSATTINVTSAPVTATPSGAIGTVTYAWTRTDGGTQPWTIDSPTSSTTTFSTVCDQTEEFTATFICTITDRAGQTVASATVTADCANIFYGGGYKGAAPPPPGGAYP